MRIINQKGSGGNAASRWKKRNTELCFAGDRCGGDPFAAAMPDLAHDDRHCAYRDGCVAFPALLKKGEVGMYEDLLHQTAAADPRDHKDVRQEMKHKKTGVYDRSFA